MTNKPHNFDHRGLETTQNTRGFMHTLNEISQTFIDYAPKSKGLIVDMGVAYGVATLPILEQHLDVIACDMEQAHLDEVQKRLAPELEKHLTLKHGSFPKDFHFESKSIGAILLSHILHFLSPDEMELALEKLSQWLMPEGKVFLAFYTPYLKIMENFIPIYGQRVADGIAWPYWVKNNVKDYFVGLESVKQQLPDTMQYLDTPIVTDALKRYGFSIEEQRYLDPEKNNVPPGAILDGREWAGIIAIKD